MSLIKKIKESVRGSPAEQYSYRCETCHATFESSEENPGVVSCVGCGSQDVRRLTVD